MVGMHFGGDAVVGLRYLISDFGTSKVGERVIGVGGPATAHLEMESHVRSELREQLQFQISIGMEASASAGQEEANAGNVMGGGAAKNPVEQETPRAEVAHVHQGGKGWWANNCLRSCTSDETRKLVFDSIKSMDLAGKGERMSAHQGQPAGF
jgi:hypothetical protein